MDNMKLVGYLEHDLNGPDRLNKILETERPDVIVVNCRAEDYNLALGMHRNHMKLIDKATDEVQREMLKSRKYHAWVPQEFAKYTGAYIEQVREPHLGSDGIVYPKITADIQNRPKEEIQQMIDSHYDMHDIGSLVDDPEEYRESLILCNVRNSIQIGYIREEEPGKMIVLSNVLNIYGNHSPNLYDSLSDLQPSRMLLKEADDI